MKYDVLYNSHQLIKKYGVTFFLSSIACFFIGSLLTFNSTDSSWFYHTSQARACKNIFGAAGAHSAAWLIYFFGQAVYLFIPLSLYFLSCYYFLCVSKKMKINSEWDRTLGVIVGFLSTTIFCQVYTFACYDFTYPGGIVGKFLMKKLLMSFDLITQKIIVITLLASSFVLITRCSYFVVIAYLFKVINYLCDGQKLPAQIVSRIFLAMYFVTTFLARLVRKTFDLLSGAMLDKIDSSIVEFEYDGVVDTDIDQVMHDLFWDEYTTDSLKPKTLMATKTDYDFKDEVEVLDEVLPKFSSVDYHISRQEKIFDPAKSIKTKQSKKELKDAVVSELQVAQKEQVYELPFLPVKKIEQKIALEKQDVLASQAKLLEEKLNQFDIKGTVVAMLSGPVVSLFEYQPDIKVKVSRILSLEDDLAMALKALSIRIIAPIPGRSVVGFEVANRDRQDVLFSTILDSPAFKKHTGFLPMIFGQDTLGNNVVADLAKMPHLLIAGSTGSGKSVALNAMLVSLLCSLRPDQLKLIIIDPKRLEFAAYDGIAHLIFPIVTETKKAIPVLKWVVQTMEDRYKIMAAHGVKNLLDYQAAAKLNKEMEPMPLMVVIIDELADLMMTAGKAVEDSIARLAQMARAAGIHMIIATQRPSVDVITGMIKVNFPNRVAFKVTSKIDSRTILDASGAEKLLGRGDMLFLDATKSHLVRVHGAYVSDAEIHGVVAQIKRQQSAQYLDLFEQFSDQHQDDLLDTDDDLYQDVLTLLKDLDEVSISMLQRRFRIGYNRSARIISTLESKGLIISMEGGKTRRVVK